MNGSASFSLLLGKCMSAEDSSVFGPFTLLPFLVLLQGFGSLLTAMISFDRGSCGHRPQLGSEQGCLVLESVPLPTLPLSPHPEDHEVGGGQEGSSKHYATLHGFVFIQVCCCFALIAGSPKCHVLYHQWRPDPRKT